MTGQGYAYEVYAATYPAALEAQRIMRIAHPRHDIVIDIADGLGYIVRRTLNETWCQRCSLEAVGAVDTNVGRLYLCAAHLGGFLYGTATREGVAK